MAFTVGQRLTTDEDVFAALRFEVVDLVFDTTYPAGGYTGIRAALGFAQALLVMQQLTRVDNTNFFDPVCYESNSDKLHFYLVASAANASLTEYPGGTGMTNQTRRFFVIGH